MKLPWQMGVKWTGTRPQQDAKLVVYYHIAGRQNSRHFAEEKIILIFFYESW